MRRSNLFNTWLKKKSIRIESKLSIDAVLIHADPIRLQQVIWNILTNAVKFSPVKSTIIVELKIINEQKKNFIQLKVSDQGKGILPEFIPHLFNQFSQADKSSAKVYGGLGLGLSIARSLIMLQGGTISAENSSDGMGAIFTVTLPIIPPQTAILPTEVYDTLDVHSKASVESPNLDGLRILIVDDDENTLEVIGISLKSFGSEVMMVRSAAEALGALSTFNPNILLSDIGMPIEDGYSLMKKIRALPADSGGLIVAVALSAYTTDKDIKKSLAAGFQAHVAKPVNATDLGRAILGALKSVSENSVTSIV